MKAVRITIEQATLDSGNVAYGVVVEFPDNVNAYIACGGGKRDAEILADELRDGPAAFNERLRALWQSITP